MHCGFRDRAWLRVQSVVLCNVTIVLRALMNRALGVFAPLPDVVVTVPHRTQMMPSHSVLNPATSEFAFCEVLQIRTSGFPAKCGHFDMCFHLCLAFVAIERHALIHAFGSTSSACFHCRASPIRLQAGIGSTFGKVLEVAWSTCAFVPSCMVARAAPPGGFKSPKLACCIFFHSRTHGCLQPFELCVMRDLNGLPRVLCCLYSET